jgi:hypothetical protein
LLRRAACWFVVTIVIVAMAAPTADAHTLTGVAATNYRSELITVTPSTPGVAVRVLDLGRQIEVRNDSPSAITVLGYYDEPYLRVGPDGAFENANSPSTYTNRTPTEVPPAGVSATSPPQWHQLNRGHVARWRDQRIRWEGPDSQQVRRAPGSEHVVRNWQLTLRAGDTTSAPPIFVLGKITWIPPSTAAPWLALTAIVALAAFLAIRPPLEDRLLAAAVATIVAVDTVNVTGGVAFSTSGTSSIVASLITRDPLTSIAWISGLAALIALRRHDHRAVFLAAATGWILMITSGVSDADVFTRSVIPSKFDPTVVRLYTALTIGIGVGLSAAAVRVVIQQRQRRRVATLGRRR